MRSIPAARSLHGKQPPDRQFRSRRGRVALALAALASIAFLVGACGSASTSSSSTTNGSATSGTGVVTRSGSGSQSGNSTTGGYSVAFAECMRAHGVPKFPNPNGSGNQLGLDSGVNPSSSAYQAALNGPCESLAPAGWVSSGLITRGGGS
jgi:hypothetical protein